jgi:hypothetical protein
MFTFYFYKSKENKYCKLVKKSPKRLPQFYLKYV